MFFHFAALDAHIFFELTLGYVEGVAQGHVQILVRLLVMTLAADHDMLIGNAEVDADVEEITLLLVLMIKLNSHPATDNVVTELLQFRRFFANFRLCGIGVGYAAEHAGISMAFQWTPLVVVLAIAAQFLMLRMADRSRS